MPRYFKVIILITSYFLLFIQKSEAQSYDSLKYRLDQIKSASDTNNLKEAFTWLSRMTAEDGVKNDLLDAIENLKAVVDDIDYNDLITSYFDRLVAINTPATNTKALEFGNKWLLKHDRPGTKYGHYTFLGILRELRMVFRNTGNLSESIEFYSSWEKKLLSQNDSAGVSIADNVLSGSYIRLGMFERGVDYQLKSIAFLNNSQEDYTWHSIAILLGVSGKVNRYAVLGAYCVKENRPAMAAGYLNEAIRYYHQLDSPLLMNDVPYLFLTMASCKTLEKNDSSSYFFETAWNCLKIYKSPPLEFAYYHQEKSTDFMNRGMLDSALQSINRTIKLRDSLSLPLSSYIGELLPGYYKAGILLKMNRAAEAIDLLEEEIGKVRKLNLNKILVKEIQLLALAYHQSGNIGEAYRYTQEAYLLLQDIINKENENRFIGYETEKKIQENEKTILLLDAQNKSNKKIKLYLIGIVSMLGLLAAGLAVFYRNKRKTNRELSLKNERLAFTLQKLQATQTQLIQSEKMASLGELTAGIAHEIQNPLNFVNNFSELNQELATELVEEADKGNTDLVKQIAADIKGNAEKINHHGKRADAIVKGMLQHSRSSSGQKEMTDINALCDEYLRLAYHGWRAKDHSFNAKFETRFGESVRKINVIPQDLGRVILNLINNAFFAVNERAKAPQPPKGGVPYEPTVTVSTSLSPHPGRGVGGEVIIRITDNGTGIPKSVVEKIFQPFFTTKPTGQGTGLGLSLSYDIVKAHGGEIKVESEEGKGTVFIIELPVTN